MTTRDAILIGAGILALLVVVSLVWSDEETASDIEKQDARRFRDLWPLFDSNGVPRALAEHPETFDEMLDIDYPAQTLDAAKLAGAVGLVDDKEYNVLSTVMRKNLGHTVSFASNFRALTGMMPGPFILTFMHADDSDDAPFLAQIVRHIEAMLTK